MAVGGFEDPRKYGEGWARSEYSNLTGDMQGLMNQMMQQSNQQYKAMGWGGGIQSPGTKSAVTQPFADVMANQMMNRYNTANQTALGWGQNMRANNQDYEFQRAADFAQYQREEAIDARERQKKNEARQRQNPLGGQLGGLAGGVALGLINPALAPVGQQLGSYLGSGGAQNYAKGGLPNQGRPALLLDLLTGEPAGIMNEEAPELIVPLDRPSKPGKAVAELYSSKTPILKKLSKYADGTGTDMLSGGSLGDIFQSLLQSSGAGKGSVGLLRGPESANLPSFFSPASLDDKDKKEDSGGGFMSKILPLAMKLAPTLLSGGAVSALADGGGGEGDSRAIRWLRDAHRQAEEYETMTPSFSGYADGTGETLNALMELLGTKGSQSPALDKLKNAPTVEELAGGSSPYSGALTRGTDRIADMLGGDRKPEIYKARTDLASKELGLNVPDNLNDFKKLPKTEQDEILERVQSRAKKPEQGFLPKAGSLDYALERTDVFSKNSFSKSDALRFLYGGKHTPSEGVDIESTPISKNKGRVGRDGASIKKDKTNWLDKAKQYLFGAGSSGMILPDPNAAVRSGLAFGGQDYSHLGGNPYEEMHNRYLADEERKRRADLEEREMQNKEILTDGRLLQGQGTVDDDFKAKVDANKFVREEVDGYLKEVVIGGAGRNITPEQFVDQIVRKVSSGSGTEISIDDRAKILQDVLDKNVHVKKFGRNKSPREMFILYGKSKGIPRNGLSDKDYANMIAFAEFYKVAPSRAVQDRKRL